MARTVLPFVGAAVGFWIGGPTGAQVGFALGGVVGNAVDPVKNIGPRIGETGAQTSAEGAPRAIVYGTAPVTGNVIVSGALIKGDFESEGGKGGPVNVTERCFRTYAIRICEGPIGGVLRIWENDKLVADFRASSLIPEETEQWMFGCGIYYGTEDQLPDSFLTVNTYADNPAYRGTAYMVFVFRDLTDFRGAIPQYRFEVATEVEAAAVGGPTASAVIPVYSPGAQPQNYMVQLHYKDENGVGQSTAMVGTATAQLNTSTSVPYTLYELDENLNSIVTTSVPTGGGSWAGTGAAFLWNYGYGGRYMFCANASFPNSYTYIAFNGSFQARIKPDAGSPDNWFASNVGTENQNNGRRVWFSEDHLYVGVVNRSGVPVNAIYRWSLAGSIGMSAYADSAVSPITFANGAEFYMHLGRDGKLRTLNDTADLVTYDFPNVESTEALPFSIANCHGFGVDEDVACFVYSGSPGRMDVRNVSDWSLQASYTDSMFNGTNDDATRLVFADGSLFVQCEQDIKRFEYTSGVDGLPVILGDIVADIHSRCQVNNSEFDVSELSDEVAGLVLAGEYTGADAINTLRGPYFFDKAEYDQKLWYPKRGAAVVDVLTIDDLIDEPDTQMREQAIEYPRKFHLFYQHAGSGYAVVKATSQRSSPDVQVVGEVTTQAPVVFANAEDEAAQTVAKMHKVSWAEAEGEVKFSLPWSFLGLVPSNNIGMSLRGRVNRLRLTELALHDGVIDVTARHDRQSAYTSSVTGIPIPDPTPPPDTIVGDTTLLVLDIPSLRDTDDDLNIYYAVNGTQPAWYGAVVQRSTDGGSTWANVATITSPGRMGELTVALADASEDYTDTTNSVHVRLYRDTQTLESVTEAQFLSEQNAFALENADGTWELMQARDWVQDSAGDWVGTRLHRGRLNTTTNAHDIGRRFVMLDDLVHVPTQSSMIGQTVYHRAPSLGQSPELAVQQNIVYTGASQIEWPPASLVLARSGANIVTGSWAPRYRFGTDDAPVNSINMIGYRITIVGSSTVVLPDQTANSFSYDASALGASVVVSVQTLNRITGAGPATSGTI